MTPGAEKAFDDVSDSGFELGGNLLDFAIYSFEYFSVFFLYRSEILMELLMFSIPSFLSFFVLLAGFLKTCIELLMPFLTLFAGLLDVFFELAVSLFVFLAGPF